MAKFAFALLFLIPTATFAGGITAPFTLTTTQVLPKGVRSIQVGGVTTMIDNWHNNQGLVTGVAEPMVQQLSYRRLLESEPDENLKLNVESQLRAKGVDLDEVAGTSLADVNTRVTVTLPALAYGVKDWWTLAVAVPILYTNIDADTAFAGTVQLQELVTNFSQKSRGQTQTIERKLRDVIATELASKNYLPLEDQERTEVGDVTVLSKMLLYSGLHWRWGLIQRLTLPTGRTRATNRLIDPAAGDGQWDIGLTNLIELPMTGKFTIVHETTYLAQLPDHQDTRVPFSVNDRLSRDLDERAYRDMGDISSTQISFIYQPWDIFSFGAGYFAAYKARDYWTGGVAEQVRYEVLGHETEQYMQAGIANLGLTTVPLFQRGRFPVPFNLNLYYSRVFDGRNVRNADLWSANVAMFF